MQINKNNSINLRNWKLGLDISGTLKIHHEERMMQCQYKLVQGKPLVDESQLKKKESKCLKYSLYLMYYVNIDLCIKNVHLYIAVYVYIIICW